MTCVHIPTFTRKSEHDDMHVYLHAHMLHFPHLNSAQACSQQRVKPVHEIVLGQTMRGADLLVPSPEPFLLERAR